MLRYSNKNNNNNNKRWWKRPVTRFLCHCLCDKAVSISWGADQLFIFSLSSQNHLKLMCKPWCKYEYVYSNYCCFRRPFKRESSNQERLLETHFLWGRDAVFIWASFTITLTKEPWYHFTRKYLQDVALKADTTPKATPVPQLGQSTWKRALLSLWINQAVSYWQVWGVMGTVWRGSGPYWL